MDLTAGQILIPDIVIGAKLGSEPTILIHMYKLLIEDGTNLTVLLEPGLGKTDFNFSALKQGSIDIYPEFSGTAIVSLLGEEAESNNAQEVYEQARKGMEEVYHMAFLQPMEYNNTYTVATTKEIADKYDLEEIGDLRNIEDRITAGFTLEFKDRQDGYAGMQEVYNLHLKNIRTMEPGIRQEALLKKEVDIIDGYATDSYMAALDLVTLEDPEHLFPPYQGAPLLKKDTLKKHPELEGILNQLGGMITDEEMREMNYLVDYEDHSPKKVAEQFLTEKGLLK